MTATINANQITRTSGNGKKRTKSSDMKIQPLLLMS